MQRARLDRPPCFVEHYNCRPQAFPAVCGDAPPPIAFDSAAAAAIIAGGAAAGGATTTTTRGRRGGNGNGAPTVPHDGKSAPPPPDAWGACHVLHGHDVPAPRAGAFSTAAKGRPPASSAAGQLLLLR